MNPSYILMGALRTMAVGRGAAKEVWTGDWFSVLSGPKPTATACLVFCGSLGLMCHEAHVYFVCLYVCIAFVCVCFYVCVFLCVCVCARLNLYNHTNTQNIRISPPTRAKPSPAVAPALSAPAPDARRRPTARRPDRPAARGGFELEDHHAAAQDQAGPPDAEPRGLLRAEGV